MKRYLIVNTKLTERYFKMEIDTLGMNKMFSMFSTIAMIKVALRLVPMSLF